MTITTQYAPEFTPDDVILSTVILEDIAKDTQQLHKVGKLRQKVQVKRFC